MEVLLGYALGNGRIRKCSLSFMSLRPVLAISAGKKAEIENEIHPKSTSIFIVADAL